MASLLLDETQCPTVIVYISCPALESATAPKGSGSFYQEIVPQDYNLGHTMGWSLFSGIYSDWSWKVQEIF